MVDLVAHCLHPATIADEDRATWVWESPFLVTPVLSNGSLSAIELASCEGDLDVPVSLWQWVSLSETLVSGPDMRAFIFVCRVCQRSLVGLTLPSQIELVTYEVENLLRDQF